MMDHNEYILRAADEVLLYVAQPKFKETGVLYSEVVRELSINISHKNEILSFLFDEKRYFRAAPSLDPKLFITQKGIDAVDMITERYRLIGKIVPYTNAIQMRIDQACELIIQLHKNKNGVLYWNKSTFNELNIVDPYSAKARLIDAGFIIERKGVERTTDIAFDYKNCESYADMIRLKNEKQTQVVKQIIASNGSVVLDGTGNSFSGHANYTFKDRSESEKKNYKGFRKIWEYCSNNKLIVSITMLILGYILRILKTHFFPGLPF